MSARRAPRREPSLVAVGAAMPDPALSARDAGLRHVTDEQPGITRRRAGKGFLYLHADGQPMRDADTLLRIRKLAIPPAWTSVWICPDERGHLQATGRDVKGRKQYRYHPRWRAIRDETKYGRMAAFGRALPRIRRRTEEDLGRRGLPREKVLATVVRLLEITLIRVGNEEYARANRSFGLTTLRDQHVSFQGSLLRFEFRGKSGKAHCIGIKDRRLARIVQQCQDVPGRELFQYLDDDGRRQTLDSGDVNEYLREITGQEFTSKDFRTWAGTVMAAWALGVVPCPRSKAQAKRVVNQAIQQVSSRLGNTPAVCRRCYIHPAVIDAFGAGRLAEAMRQRPRASWPRPPLPRPEALVLYFLEQQLEAAESLVTAA